MEDAKKETDKAKKILTKFNKLNILLCHQPPYGILDKMLNRADPKDWYGKHVGSEAILKYIKRKQPKYVFCGHMYESKGKKNIKKTQIYNVGAVGDYILLDI